MPHDTEWLLAKMYLFWNLDYEELKGQTVDYLPQNMLILVKRLIYKSDLNHISL